MPASNPPHRSMPGAFEHPNLYDSLARRFLRGLYAKVTADVGAAHLSGGDRLLDVGTGPGRVPLAVADLLPDLRIDGIDLSPSMIAKARELARVAGLEDRVTFIVGDVADLPYPDQVFDLIVSTVSQHHWADVAAAFRELRRVLRPDGQIWIYDLRAALRGAETAARAAFPEHTIRRETVPIARLLLRPIGRLTIRPA